MNQTMKWAFPLIFLGSGCAEMKTVPVRLYRGKFILAQPGLSTAKVLDAEGHEVRTLWKNKGLPVGAVELTWDGRDEKGETASAGVYTLALNLERWSLK